MRVDTPISNILGTHQVLNASFASVLLLTRSIKFQIYYLWMPSSQKSVEQTPEREDKSEEMQVVGVIVFSAKLKFRNADALKGFSG